METDVIKLIGHPELLDKDTLYGLRELVARYPYFQAARLLFLQNLFLLHDPSFGDELRRAALFLPDRRVIFDMVEGRNYVLHPMKQIQKRQQEAPTPASRTQTLIDDFLRNAPAEDETHRRPTVADATGNYAAFLMQLEDAEPEDGPTDGNREHSQTLLDDFIRNKPERIVLQDEPEFVPELDEDDTDEAIDEDYFTETLAKIYIKQGRYEKALEIIRKLSLNYPKKNSYFADQIRFLQKLIINNKNKK